jgi:hypothetical protein
LFKYVPSEQQDRHEIGKNEKKPYMVIAPEFTPRFLMYLKKAYILYRTTKGAFQGSLLSYGSEKNIF